MHKMSSAKSRKILGWKSFKDYGVACNDNDSEPRDPLRMFSFKKFCDAISALDNLGLCWSLPDDDLRLLWDALTDRASEGSNDLMAVGWSRYYNVLEEHVFLSDDVVAISQDQGAREYSASPMINPLPSLQNIRVALDPPISRQELPKTRPTTFICPHGSSPPQRPRRAQPEMGRRNSDMYAGTASFIPLTKHPSGSSNDEAPADEKMYMAPPKPGTSRPRIGISPEQTSPGSSQDRASSCESDWSWTEFSSAMKLRPPPPTGLSSKITGCTRKNNSVVIKRCVPKPPPSILFYRQKNDGLRTIPKTRPSPL